MSVGPILALKNVLSNIEYNIKYYNELHFSQITDEDREKTLSDLENDKLEFEKAIELVGVQNPVNLRNLIIGEYKELLIKNQKYQNGDDDFALTTDEKRITDALMIIIKDIDRK